MSSDLKLQNILSMGLKTGILFQVEMDLIESYFKNRCIKNNLKTTLESRYVSVLL